MNHSRFASLALAALLNFAPFATRCLPSLPSLIQSPASILFKWVLGAIAVTGSMHTVSAATARLVSASSLSGRVGTRLSYQIRINDGQNRQPKSWTVGGRNFGSTGTATNGLPPGLALALGTGIISGTPGVAGDSAVSITAYEHSNRSGGKLTFTLSFSITGNATPPGFTTQPTGGSWHPGDVLTLSVTTTGSAPLTFLWKKDGQPLGGPSDSPSLTLTNLSGAEAGSYTIEVSGPGGTAISNPAIVALVPLGLRIPGLDGNTVRLVLDTLPGRSYALETTSAPGEPAWNLSQEFIATAIRSEIAQAVSSAPAQFWRYRALP